MRSSRSASRGRPRIGVVGIGRIGQRHVGLIRDSPFCELAGIADVVPEARALALDVGTRLHQSVDALLAAERMDGVIVATPNAMHLEHVLACIGAGVPVLVEKPIATTVVEGTAMVEAAENAGVPLLVGHHRRHSPRLAAARRVVKSGDLGEIVAVMGTALFHKPDDYFEAAPWRREPGGGPILINLVHEVDSLRWVLGDIVSVQAIGSSAIRQFPVEDTVAMSMRFASGALGAFLLSDTAASVRSWEQTSGEDPSYPQDPDQDCYLVAGTRGSLAIPTLRMMVHDVGAPSWHRPMRTTVVRAAPADPLARQLEHFCAVIRGEAEPLVSGRDAIETLRVTLAIAEAASTRPEVACAPARHGSP